MSIRLLFTSTKKLKEYSYVEFTGQTVSFKYPVDIVDSVQYGYSKEQATEKIKQLVKDIKTGDFTKTCVDFAHPDLMMKRYANYYRGLKGKNLEQWFKSGDTLAYCAGDWKPEGDWFRT